MSIVPGVNTEAELREWLQSAAPEVRGREQGRAAETPRKPQKATPGMVFQAMCVAAGLPKPEPEWKFDPKRKWRVDWAFFWSPVAHLALEVEGGVWTQGRHTRGKGFLGDLEKYNALACMGVWLLRCTPAEIKSGAAVELVRKFAESQGLVEVR